MRSWELMRKLSLYQDPEGDPEIEEEPEPEESADPEPAPGLPIDVLPENLRGRSAEEIRAELNRAFSRSDNVDDLRRELNELKTSISRPKEPEKPAEPEKPIDELLYENPEEAIDRVIQKKYGSRFAGLEQQVGSTVFATMRSQLPDFDEVEDDVKGLLRESGAPATQQNIMGAYQMVLGRKAMEERTRASRRASNPEKPKPKPDKPKGPQLSELEKDIAKGMGMSMEEYAEARDNEDYDIKVPS